MLNNSINYSNLISAGAVTSSLNNNYLFTIGIPNEQYGGDYRPVVVKWSDILNSIPLPVVPQFDYYYAGNTGTSKNIDWSDGVVQEVNLDNDPTITFSNGELGKIQTLLLRQGLPGQRVITWSSDFVWNNNDPLVLSTLPAGGNIDTTFQVGTGFEGTIPAASSWVLNLAQQPDNKVLVAGRFVKYNGVSSNYIARLNTDGSLDNSFNIGTGFDSDTQTVTLQSDGKILVGGWFSSYNGVSKNYIVRLNSDGTLDNTFNIGTGFNSGVDKILVQPDGKILVSGYFTTYDSVVSNRIIRLNPDGSIDATNSTSFSSNIQTLELQPDGKIVIGGWFSGGIRRLNSDLSNDATFNIGTGFNSSCLTILIQTDGKILAGGNFSSYNGSGNIYNRIIRLNTDGSVDSTFNSGTGFNSYVTVIKVDSDGKIIVGGGFGSYNGGLVSSLIKLNFDGSVNTTFVAKSFSSNVDTLIFTPDNNYLVGGNFNTYDGLSSNGIVSINALPVPVFNIVYIVYNGVNYVGLKSNDVYTTSGTYSAGTLSLNSSNGSSVSITGFAKYNYINGGSSSLNTINWINGQTQELSFTNTNSTIAFTNGYTGEKFRLLLNPVSEGVSTITWPENVLWSNNSPLVLPSVVSSPNIDSTFTIGTGFNSNPRNIDIQSDGKIVVGGEFTTYNSITRNRIARLNTNGTDDSTFSIGTGFDSFVTFLKIQSDQKVVVVGNFSAYNGTSRTRIARLNTNGSNDTTFTTGSGLNSTPNVIEIQSDGKIIIGGFFTVYNTSNANRIVRLNSDGTIDTTFITGTGFNSEVYGLAVQSDGKILVGGAFTEYNGVSNNRIVRLNPDGSIDTSFNIGTGFNGRVETVLVEPSGKIIVGGHFKTYNDTSANRIIRLNSDGSIDTSFNTGTGFDPSANIGVTQIKRIKRSSTGKLFVIGSFTAYNGTQCVNFAIINSDGSLSATFVNTYSNLLSNGYFNDLLVLSNNNLIVGGGFSTIRSTSALRIARLTQPPYPVYVTTNFDYNGSFYVGSY